MIGKFGLSEFCHPSKLGVAKIYKKNYQFAIILCEMSAVAGQIRVLAEQTFDADRMVEGLKRSVRTQKEKVCRLLGYNSRSNLHIQFGVCLHNELSGNAFANAVVSTEKSILRTM